MKNEIPNAEIVQSEARTTPQLSASISSLALASIPPQAQGLMLRMFADPYILEKDEKASLVVQLRSCVEQYPEVSELRVLLGMALSVNLDAQAAIEELRESVRLAPNSFIAQLKFGELWMHLRVVDKAEEHTRLAALLSRSLPQSELARRQAATLRTMKREGIERGGYQSPFGKVTRSLRQIWTRRRNEPSVALEVS
jgi:hypothetical protein